MLAALDNGVIRRQIANLFSRHKGCSPSMRSMCSEPIPMRKPTTGEPCAGEPHARFGGRGGHNPSRPLSDNENEGAKFVIGLRPLRGVTISHCGAVISSIAYAAAAGLRPPGAAAYRPGHQAAAI